MKSSQEKFLRGCWVGGRPVGDFLLVDDARWCMKKIGLELFIQSFPNSLLRSTIEDMLKSVHVVDRQLEKLLNEGESV